MNLYQEYLLIDPNLEVLYVEPSIYDESNDYLRLLYKDMKEKLVIKEISKFHYPLLMLLKLKGQNSIMHHHWFQIWSWKSSLTAFWKLFWLLCYKIVGGKVIWTVHNISPHNQKYLWLNKSARILFAKIATKLHVHCNNAVEIMNKVLKVNKDKFFVVEHPNYEVEIYSKDEAIKRFIQAYPEIKIDFSNKIFLVFGQMAKYKGIKELLDVMKDIDEEYVLLLAGQIKDRNDEYIDEIKKYKSNEKIVFIDRFIPNENVSVLFNLADCVLFNYLKILTSGGVILALNYKKQSIAPKKACISEIEDDNLKTFETQEELKEIIIEEILYGER